jgi:hypothetical protein
MPNGIGAEGGIGDVQPVTELGQDLDLLNDEGDGTGKGSADEKSDEEQIEDDAAELGKEDEDEGEGEGKPKEGDEEEEEEDAEKPKGRVDETDEEREIRESGRPTFKDIKAKYPTIFKDFPKLRELIFREYQFSKSLGEPEEAQDLMGKAKDYDIVESSLVAGDPAVVINSLAKNNPEALDKVADNWLPTLRKHSSDLYVRVVTPVIQEALHFAFENGKNNGNKNLMFGAQHISNLLFGDAEIKPPAAPKKEEPHPAEVKLREEQERWSQTRFQETREEVNRAIDSRLDSVIRRGLNTDGKLSDYELEHVVQDTMTALMDALGKDEAHKASMRAHWKRASQNGFAKEARAKLSEAFIARAIALVPGVRARIRAKALGEKGKPDSRDNKPEQQLRKRVIPNTGRSGINQPRTLRPSEVDYSKTSDMDILMDRETRRK